MSILTILFALLLSGFGNPHTNGAYRQRPDGDRRRRSRPSPA